MMTEKILKKSPPIKIDFIGTGKSYTLDRPLPKFEKKRKDQDRTVRRLNLNKNLADKAARIEHE